MCVCDGSTWENYSIITYCGWTFLISRPTWLGFLLELDIFAKCVAFFVTQGLHLITLFISPLTVMLEDPNGGAGQTSAEHQ